MFSNQLLKSSLSYEYIRGLVDGEGCFTFYPRTQKLANGGVKKEKIPAFVIAMHERDEELLRMMRNTLKLRNSIYIYNSYQGDGHKRGRKAVLVVREFGQLKNIIIPLFYDKLNGYKKIQFIDWLEKIGNSPDVPKSYKLFYKLHKCGFYRRECSPGGMFAKFIG